MRRIVLLAGHLALAALLALPASPLRADVLGDVRAALGRLQPVATVKARVEIARTETEKEKPKREKHGRVVAEYGPEGLVLRVAPADLPQPRPAGAKARDEAVALDAANALKLLDPAEDLRRLLDGATFVSDRSETFEGRSIRAVAFRPVADMDEEDRKAVKRYDDLVTLRLETDGTPVSLDRVLDVKVSKLLFSFTVSHRESRRFARHAGRLVTTSASEESSGSGLGQSSGSKTVYSVSFI